MDREWRQDLLYEEAQERAWENRRVVDFCEMCHQPIKIGDECFKLGFDLFCLKCVNDNTIEITARDYPED